LAVGPVGCRPAGGTPTPATLASGAKLKVVATTNIVGDVVRNVAGDRIDLTELMGIGVDPHSYVATPKDVRAVHDADIVFASGAGLEEFLGEMLENAGGNALHIDLSDSLKLRAPEGGKENEGDQDQSHGAFDPHVWFSVPHVIRWVKIIQNTLSDADPENSAVYGANAEQYVRKLEALDTWIQEQVERIPQNRRKLVTNHAAFGYFAERYGLEQVGVVYPISPSAEPSAQDIARLETIIRKHDIPAAFSESTVNPKLAEQVAQDTGITLVQLYTGSLGGPGSGAETYVDLMRFDVKAIVQALAE
jgi:manganese/iron transport system substrate-binding protein